jgi:RNA polymerase sigma-70 factor (sigma-E family)
VLAKFAVACNESGVRLREGGVRDEQVTFEEFLTDRLPALIRYSTALAGDPDTGADVLQDVLLKAQARWTRIVVLQVPEAYIRKMVINELVSTRRRLTARLRRERLHPPVSVEDRSEQFAEREALMRLIRALPDRQRIVIALRYFEDMADGDIAVLMGCNIATVRSQASRALATLRGVAALEPSLEEQ